MPMYEYACPNCGFQFERVQRFEDKPLKVCPNCKKRNAHRVISRVAVSFKGGGFYVNDSKSSNPVSKGESVKPDTAIDTKTEPPVTNGTSAASDNKATSPSESKSESKTESQVESKGDSKSESKPESKPTKPTKKSE